METIIKIAKEIEGPTGYKSIEFIDTIPYNKESIDKIELHLDIVRSFKSPFNSSVLVVVVK